MTSDGRHAPYGPLPEGGKPRAITRWGTPVMHRRQADVTAYDEELRTLVADMAATMYAADGVGLAACQVGVDLRVFVFDCPDSTGDHTVGVVCNPMVPRPQARDSKLRAPEAGWTPFRARSAAACRPDAARVTGFGVDGEPVVFEGDGLLARCLQHETDHTLGTVFADRLSTKAQKKLRKAHEKVADEFPLTWPAEED
jgi:peptide deformylase